MLLSFMKHKLCNGYCVNIHLLLSLFLPLLLSVCRSVCGNVNVCVGAISQVARSMSSLDNVSLPDLSSLSVCIGITCTALCLNVVHPLSPFLRFALCVL